MKKILICLCFVVSCGDPEVDDLGLPDTPEPTNEVQIEYVELPSGRLAECDPLTSLTDLELIGRAIVQSSSGEVVACVVDDIIKPKKCKLRKRLIKWCKLRRKRRKHHD